MLGETEKSSDVCRTVSLSEMGYEKRAATSSTVTITIITTVTICGALGHQDMFCTHPGHVDVKFYSALQ